MTAVAIILWMQDDNELSMAINDILKHLKELQKSWKQAEKDA